MGGKGPGTFRTVALVIPLGVMLGCEATRSNSAAKLDATRSADARSTALAVAATQPAAFRRGSSISFFGELDAIENVPFASEAASGIQRHTFTREGGDFDPAVDPTGRLLIFSSTRHSTRPDIYVKAVGGSAITQLTDDPSSDVQPDISPDGKWVAYASNRTGNWDIWITSIDGQTTQQLTKSPKAEVRPSWSSDGQRLAYCSLNPRTRRWELWMADMRQPGSLKFIGHGLFPRWSPKDDVILFQRARARGSHWFSVWTIRLVNGEPMFPTEIASSSDHALISPSWMPDGKRIVYCSIESDPAAARASGTPATRGDIWITDSNGMGKIRLTKGDSVYYSPVCGHDGRIYFASNRSGSENIWSMTPSSPPAPVAAAISGGEVQ